MTEKSQSVKIYHFTLPLALALCLGVSMPSMAAMESHPRSPKKIFACPGKQLGFKIVTELPRPWRRNSQLVILDKVSIKNDGNQSGVLCGYIVRGDLKLTRRWYDSGFLSGLVSGPPIGGLDDCPEEVESVLTPNLDKSWIWTPSITNLRDSNVLTINGKPTLVCSYDAYPAVSVMRQLPANALNCVTTRTGVECE